MIYFIGNNLFPYQEIENASLQDMLDYCKAKKLLGVDIETSRKFKKGKYDERVYKPGLDPYTSRIVMIQIGDKDNQFIIDARSFEAKVLIKYLKPLFEDENICKVGHNLQFEGKFFFVHYNLRLINVWDTMVCEKILYNGLLRSNSLAALMLRYLDIKPVSSLNLFNEVKDHRNFESLVYAKMEQAFLIGISMKEEDAIAMVEEDLLKNAYVNKSTRLEFLKIGDKPFTLKQVLYGKDDIVYPLKIKEIQEKGRMVNGESWKPLKAFKIENKLTQVLAEKSVRGIKVDSSKWMELYESNKKEALRRKNILNKEVIKNYPDFTGTIDLFSNKPTCKIEWSSSKQVISLFKKLGIAKKEKSKSTGKLEWTVGAKTLFRYLPNDLKNNFYKSEDKEIKTNEEFSLQYLLFKKSEQLITTFGKDWLRYIHPITFKVHCNFNQYLISGRLAATSPNLMQIPNTKQFRACFIAPKNYQWISSDYSGQELRIAADVHNVKKMQDFFILGDPVFKDDFHSFSATQLFRKFYKDPNLIVTKKTHPKERDISKSLTFKLNYGGSPYTLALDLGITEKEAEDLVFNFFKGLPGMEDSFNKKKKEVLKRGWIECSAFSDKRYFYPHHNKMEDLKNKAYSLTECEQGKKIPEKEKERLRKETEWSSIWKEYMTLKGKVERRSLNLPIQGAAAEMVKLALLYLYDYRWNNNLQDKFIVMVPIHDEIDSIAETSISLEIGKVQEDLMLKAGELTCIIPMKSETGIGDHWIH